MPDRTSPLTVVAGTRFEEGGELTDVITTPAETGDRYQLRVDVEPGAGPGISRFGLHQHPGYVEDFRLVAGQMMAALGRERRRLVAGDALTIPAGTAHGFVNDGDEPLVFDLEIIFPPPGPRPEVDPMAFSVLYEAWLRERRARGKTGDLPILQSAVLLQAYPEVAQIVGPVGRLMAPLAWLGRRRGYRPALPEQGI